MIFASVLSPWCGSGTLDDPYRPLVADCFPLDRFRDDSAQDMTGGLPMPNLAVFRVSCSVETLTAIDADGRFFVLVDFS